MASFYTARELLGEETPSPFIPVKRPPVSDPPAVRRAGRKYFTVAELLGEEPSEIRDPPAERGFFAEAGSLISRGVLSAGETGLRALRTLDPEGGIDWIEEAATSGIESIERFREETPFVQPTPQSKEGWRRWVTEGVEAAVQSLLAGAPGAVAGAGIGTLFGPGVGTAIGALIGYALSGGVQFGLAEYDSFIEEAEKKGIPKSEAQTNAMLSGMAEGGFEFVSNILEGLTVGIAKPLTTPAKSALKAGLKQIFRTGFRQHLKKAGGIMFAEVSTETATAGVQAELAHDIGMGDVRFWEAAQSALGPTAVASIIFFGVGSSITSLQRRDIAKKLADTQEDKKIRLSAVNEVYKTLKDVDADIARVWKMNATIAVIKKESIAMGEDLVEVARKFREKVEKEKVEGRRLKEDEGGISDNQGMIKDIGEESVLEEKAEGRRLKAEEEKRLKAEGIMGEIIAEEEAAKIEAERIRVEESAAAEAMADMEAIAAEESAAAEPTTLTAGKAMADELAHEEEEQRIAAEELAEEKKIQEIPEPTPKPPPEQPDRTAMTEGVPTTKKVEGERLKVEGKKGQGIAAMTGKKVQPPPEAKEVIPFSERSSEEKKRIEAYNKKMTSDEWQKEYAEVEEPHYVEEKEHSPLADEIIEDLDREDLKNADILEIGTGNGRDSIFMAKKGHDVTGIDVVDKAIERAKKAARGVKNIAFEVGDAENLQYEDESFDAVYSVAALHSTPIRFTFREINRVLRPGGQAKLFLYTRTKTGDKWVSYWTPGEIKQFAEEEGFKVEKFREGHDIEAIEIPGIEGKVEQETHLVVTTLRKPKKPSPAVAAMTGRPATEPAGKKPLVLTGKTLLAKDVAGIDFENARGGRSYVEIRDDGRAWLPDDFSGDEQDAAVEVFGENVFFNEEGEDVGIPYDKVIEILEKESLPYTIKEKEHVSEEKGRVSRPEREERPGREEKAPGRPVPGERRPEEPGEGHGVSPAEPGGVLEEKKGEVKEAGVEEEVEKPSKFAKGDRVVLKTGTKQHGEVVEVISIKFTTIYGTKAGGMVGYLVKTDSGAKIQASDKEVEAETGKAPEVVESAAASAAAKAKADREAPADKEETGALTKEKKEVKLKATPEDLLAAYDRRLAEKKKEQAARQGAKPPAKEKLKEAGEHVANAVSKFKEINKLLGDEGVISFEEIDENDTTWQQVRVLLKEAWDEIVAAGKSLEEFVSIAVDNLGIRGRPYFEKFVREEIGGEEGGRKPERVEGVRTEGTRPLEGIPPDDVSGIAGEGRAERVPEGVRGEGGRGSAQPRAEGAEDLRGRRDRTAPAHPPAERGRGPEAGRNYRITDRDDIESGGKVAKYDRNIAAIKLLKKIEEEKRQATPEDQAVLVKYVGWGGMPEAFKTYSYKDTPWTGRAEKLEELLTEEEYEAARASTPNAHYTSPLIVSNIYDALKRMGFDGGRLLDPAMGGTGMFEGLVPAEWNSKIVGIELDSISGRIAKLLYPEADIRVQGYEDTKLPNDFFDLAISNVPFGDYKVFDPDYNHLKFFIHDYFFAKSIDKVRPGGLITFITSAGMMNKKDSRIREYISERAELVAAIRLPGDAFKKIANTEVTADIIFLRKLEAGKKPRGAKWVETKEYKKYLINEYFAKYPHMMLGKLVDDKLHPGRAALASDGRDLGEALAGAIDTGIPAEMYIKPVHEATEAPKTEDLMPAPDTVKNFAYFEQDGEIYQKKGDDAIPVPGTKKELGRIKGLVRLRDITRQTLHNQLEGKTDLEQSDLKKLNQVYDRFVKNYGYIHNVYNMKSVEDDPDLPLLLSLEVYDPEEKTAEKADIFRKPTMARFTPVEKVETAQDALVVSMFERGGLDFEHMARISGQSVESLEKELKGMVYLDPEGEKRVTADEYLSGNVRAKLEAARAAAEIDSKYKENIEALEKAQPEDIPPSRIKARLGMGWIPNNYIEEYLSELISARGHKVKYIPETATWVTEFDRWSGSDNMLREQRWGVHGADAIRLIGDALNLKATVITYTDSEGKSHVDQTATVNAQVKQKEIKEHFEKWIFEDIERQRNLIEIYNRNFNSVRNRKYDGGHLPDRLPGMAAWASLRPNQKDAVWRIIHGGNTMLGHVVGSGKTLSMITGAMELKRLGLSKKPLFIVPKHLIMQWQSEFMRFYPGAKLLAPTEKSLTPAQRAEFMARITTGDWDAVIITHPNMIKLPMSKKAQADFIRAQIQELEAAVIEEEAGLPAYDRGRRKTKTVKELEKSKRRLEVRLATVLKKGERDKTVTFEELGIDYMFVDESHKFKNLWAATRMTRVAGVQMQGADKTMDLFLKAQYVQRLNNGRGVIFATGTPISNSMGEMFTIQRYLAQDVLKDLQIHNFDAWAATFGDVAEEPEVTPTGSGFRMHTRFRNFINMGQLSTLFREFADIVHIEDIPFLKVPKMVGGEPDINRAEPSDEQKEYIQELDGRMDAIRSGQVDPREDNALVVTTDGVKAALDMRLIEPTLPDNPGSKVNLMINRAVDIYKKTSEDKLTQLIFCDFSIPKKDEFNVYHDVRQKLIDRGIPEKEIVFIHDANTDAKKAALFLKMNRGQVRILMGSTGKMGEGMNVQRKLIAIHHLDAPWRPSDVEQRDGRAIRPDNLNDEVHIIRYVTRGTFDAYRWQILENKAKFIVQAMKGGVDEMEDIGKAVLDYATVKAIASSNPLILEKVRVDADLIKMEAMHRGWMDQRFDLQSGIASRKTRITSVGRRIEDIKKDIETRQPKPDDKEFSFIIHGIPEYDIEEKTITDKKEAGQALAELYGMAKIEGKKKFRERTLAVGGYRGFTLYLDNIYQNTQTLFVGEHGNMIPVKPVSSYANEESAISTYISQLNREIDGLDGELKRYEDLIKKLNTEVSSLESESVNKETFKDIDKLEELRKKSREINATLMGAAPEIAPAAGRAYYKLNNNKEFEALLDAKGVEIVPWLETFIHQDKDMGTWIVSDARSGIIVRQGLSKKEAIDNARQALEGHGEEEVLGLSEQSVEEYGESPWVTGESAAKAKADMEKPEQYSVTPAIAALTKKHNLTYDGRWESLAGRPYAFTDNVTNSSVTVKDLKDLPARIKQLHESFGVLPEAAKRQKTRGFVTDAISLDDVRAVFKGQHVGISPDGDIWVRTKAGHGVTIKTVQQISEDSASFKLTYGRQKETGEFIAGKYKSGVIEIQEDIGNKWTLSHESVHFFEDAGILTNRDIAALKTRIKQLVNNGKFTTRNKEDIGGPEDRASYIADQLNKDVKGPVGRILKKIRDWVERFVNLFHRTARGVARDIETGRIFDLKTGPGAAEQAQMFATTAPPFYSQLMRAVETATDMPRKVQSLTKWLQRKQVKPAEMKWMGVEDWLKENQKEGKIDKDAFLDFLKANQIEIREIEKSVRHTDITADIQDAALTDAIEEFRGIIGEAEPGGMIDEEMIVEEYPDRDIGISVSAFWKRRVDELLNEYEDSGGGNDNASEELLKLTGVDIEGLYEQHIDQLKEGAGSPKFETYTLPGGEGYRELLFMLPEISVKQDFSLDDAAQEQYGKRFNDLNVDEKHIASLLHRRKSKDEIISPDTYRATHWDEPNVLAHVRFNERTDAEGKRVLFIEEIQSDWLQEAKEKGFKGQLKPLTPKEKTDAIDRLKQIERDIISATKDKDADRLRMLEEEARGLHNRMYATDVGVPPAPFLENWHEVCMKRMLRYAAENGFDTVAWTKGKHQIARYEDALRQNVDEIRWFKNTAAGEVEVSAKKKNNSVFSANIPLKGTTAIKGKEVELKDVIGKPLAQQIITSKEPYGTFKGEDLSIGGIGMRAFYDELLPGFMRKYVKQWSGKVGEQKIVTKEPAAGAVGLEVGDWAYYRTPEGPKWLRKDMAKNLERASEADFKDDLETVHSVDITSEMKQSVLFEGQAYYSVQKQPTGREVAQDIENDRSFVNKLFEMKDLAVFRIQNSVWDLQDQVKRLAGPASRKKLTLGFAYKPELKRSFASDQLDKAMTIRRDLGDNLEKADEFRAWAKEQLAGDIPARDRLKIKGQLKILDQAFKLTDEQNDFVDHMGDLFEDAFSLANAHKIIKTHRDNYVRRLWKLPEGKAEEFRGTGPGYGFKVYTTAAKQRTFDTILDGWMAGYELRVQGITSSYERYMTELATIMSNKAFLQRGVATVDVSGNAMFTAKPKPGYAPLKASGFSVWRWAGKAEIESEFRDEEALVVDTYGRKFFATTPERIPEQFAVYKNEESKKAIKLFDTMEEAEEFADKRHYDRIERRPPKDVSKMFEKQPLYAPKPIAEMINKMTATDTLFNTTPVAKELLRLNTGIKTWILLSSFFHHMAGTRSWVFGVHHGWKNVNPVKAFKAGLKKIEDLHPLIELGIKNGLTVGELQDWAESELRASTGLTEKLVNYLGLEKTGKVIEAGRFYRERFTDSLFKKYFAGLKAEAFVVEYTHELQKENEKYTSGRSKLPPNPNQIAERVARLINADFGGLHLKRMGRNPTLQKMARMLLLAPDWTESNFRTVSGMVPGLNKFISKTVGDVPGPKAMEDVYRRFWGRVMLRIAVSTIVAQLLLNGSDETEEFLEEQLLSNKANKLRWTEIDVTKLYHMLGVDTEGQRKTFSLGGHFFDPLKLIDPFRLVKHKGSPFVRAASAAFSGSDWAERPFTGIKEFVTTGKTIKKSAFQEKVGGLNRLPSVVVNQVVNMQPIQVGHFIRYMQGEEDGLTAIMHSMGAATHTAWGPRLETPIIAAEKGPDPVMDVINEMLKNETLNMGPPSRYLNINGVNQKMSREQYDKYLEESSTIARRKLAGIINSRRSDEWKARKIRAVIRNARKRIRGKIKRMMVKEGRRLKAEGKKEAA